MKAPLLGCLTVVVIAFAATGCGPECGKGTIEKDGFCLAAEDFLQCGPGFVIQGNRCMPESKWWSIYCDPATTVVLDDRCLGSRDTTTCTDICPPVSNGKICVQGQIFNGTELLSKGRDQATPIEDAVVEIFDLMAFVGNPNPTPLVTVPTTGKGCFIATDLQVPFLSIFAIMVQDKPTVTNKIYDRISFSYVASSSKNGTDLAMPGWTKAEVDSWGKWLGSDFKSQGMLLGWFRDPVTKLPVDGITPTKNGLEQPWGEGTKAFMFSADPTKDPAIDLSATTTTASGMVAILHAIQTKYSGTKPGFTVQTQTAGAFEADFRTVVPFDVVAQ